MTDRRKLLSDLRAAEWNVARDATILKYVKSYSPELALVAGSLRDIIIEMEMHPPRMLKETMDSNRIESLESENANLRAECEALRKSLRYQIETSQG